LGSVVTGFEWPSRDGLTARGSNLGQFAQVLADVGTRALTAAVAHAEISFA
jgi:hypothetical protein